MGTVRVLILASLLLCLAAPPPASGRVDYDVLKRGVVKLVVQKDTEDTGAGTVVGVEEKLVFIVTAYHVVRDARRIEVVFYDQPYRTYGGQLHKRHHEALDLAVVLVDVGEARRIPAGLPTLAAGDVGQLREGDRLSSIGHPLDLEWQVSTNSLDRARDPDDRAKFRFTKTSLARGSSGGPVFNEQGGLIGMVSTLHPLHAIGVKIDAVLSELREWRIPTTNLARGAGLGALVVESRPAGAQVLLDGRPVGATAAGPVTIKDLETRRYSLRVTKEGYQAWEQSVEVEPGKERAVMAQLEPLAAGPSTRPTGSVLYFYFAPEGCPHCRSMALAVERFYREYGAQAEVLGVPIPLWGFNVDGFRRATGLTIPTTPDPRLPVNTYQHPLTVFYNKQTGGLRVAAVGAVTFEALVAAFQAFSANRPFPPQLGPS
jgi:thiol-disulfide isomerase/thioredoxin